MTLVRKNRLSKSGQTKIHSKNVRVQIRCFLMKQKELCSSVAVCHSSFSPVPFRGHRFAEGWRYGGWRIIRMIHMSHVSHVMNDMALLLWSNVRSMKFGDLPWVFGPNPTIQITVIPFPKTIHVLVQVAVFRSIGRAMHAFTSCNSTKCCEIICTYITYSTGTCLSSIFGLAPLQKQSPFQSKQGSITQQRNSLVA